MEVGVVKEHGNGFVRAIGLYFIPEESFLAFSGSIDDDFQVCKLLYESASKRKKIEVRVRNDGKLITVKIKKIFYRSFKIRACEQELERLKKLSIALKQKRCSLFVVRDEEGISFRFQQNRKQQIEALPLLQKQTNLGRFYNLGIVFDKHDFRDGFICGSEGVVKKTKQLTISDPFILMINFNKKIIVFIKDLIKQGAIGVIPTDTIYGLTCSALNKKNVERVYKTRKRNLKKPVIILISSIKDLKLFSVDINKEEKKIIDSLWPNKISIILNCPNKKFEYLHRGMKTLAFRMPKDKALISLLKLTGPLIVPSANIEGDEPAKNIREAQEYFGDKVDFYIDNGNLKSEPSTIISIIDGEVSLIRKGSVKI